MKRRPDGSWRLQIMDISGKYRNFQLPKQTTKAAAQQFKSNAKRLIQCKKLGVHFDAKDVTWLSELDKALARKLVLLGVIDDARDTDKHDDKLPTIYEYIQQLIDTEQGSTVARKFRNIRDKLVSFFGKEKRLDEVTKGDAKRFAKYLTDKNTGLGLEALSTARRCIGYCRQIWIAAIDDELLTANPWKQKDLKATVKTNHDKHHYIDHPTSRRLYAVINNGDYKLRFVLMRYAGLRSPSELNALKWTDVDFAKGEITIRSPKTAHHDDRGIRRMPIFPEILDELNNAWDRAADGSVFVLPTISHHTLTKHVQRWIGTIGKELWPQLLTNFRRSAVTDKHLEGFPPHILNAWFGHSDVISKVCYRMAPEDVFTRAKEQPSQLTEEDDVTTDTQPQTQKGD